MQLQLNEEQTARLLSLACQAIHRSERAREHIAEGRTASAMAEYYAMDTGPLARAFNVIPEDIRTELLAMVQSGAGEGK